MSSDPTRPRVALVTGAARGLGRAIAIELAGSFDVIGLLDLDPPDTTAEGVRSKGARPVALRADVSRWDDVEHAVAELVAEGGTIDAAVANAGIWISAPFIDMTDEEWDRVLAVNLKGAFLLGRHVAPVMRDAGGGAIVNIASTSSFYAFTLGSQYGASKAGILGLTTHMATELGPHGIRVNAVAPGMIGTEGADFVLQVPGLVEAEEAATPLGRLGRPDDVSRAVAFLISPAAEWITGECLRVDGGISTHLEAYRHAEHTDARGSYEREPSSD